MAQGQEKKSPEDKPTPAELSYYDIYPEGHYISRLRSRLKEKGAEETLPKIVLALFMKISVSDSGVFERNDDIVKSLMVSDIDTTLEMNQYAYGNIGLPDPDDKSYVGWIPNWYLFEMSDDIGIPTVVDLKNGESLLPGDRIPHRPMYTMGGPVNDVATVTHFDSETKTAKVENFSPIRGENTFDMSFNLSDVVLVSRKINS